MADFKTSTRAMLEVVRGEKARLKKRMQELDDREAIILKWIEQEEGPQQQELPMVGAKPVIQAPHRAKPTLAEFLVEVMADGRPRTNAELGEVAKLRGIIEEDANLRGIHSTMLSLANTGAFTRREEKWIRTVKANEER